MTRKDLRTSESEWRATRHSTQPAKPIGKRSFKLVTLLKVAAVIIVLTALWSTRPDRVFQDCSGTDVPRHCVD